MTGKFGENLFFYVITPYFFRISQNDFLGHVELNVEQLEAMAASSKGRAVQLPLSDKESHGVLHLQLGFTSNWAPPVGGEEAEEPALYLALQRAENLDKIDTVHLSSPFGASFTFCMRMRALILKIIHPRTHIVRFDCSQERCSAVFRKMTPPPLNAW